MKKLFILLIILGTFGFLFFNVVLPKVMISYMQSDAAPEVFKEVSREIESSSQEIVATINRSGLTKTEATELLKSLDSSVIKSMIEELNESGFKNKQECVEIIASHFQDTGIDTQKLKTILSQNLSVRELQSGVEELSSINQAAIATALPMIKEILNKELSKLE